MANTYHHRSVTFCSESQFHPKGKSPSRTPGPDGRIPSAWTQTAWFPATRPRRQRPWRLAPGLCKTSFFAFQKPCGLSPLAQIKCSRTQTFRETSGTPSGEFRNPSRDQTLLSDISIFIFGPFRSTSSCP